MNEHGASDENPYQPLNDPASISPDDIIRLPESQSRGMTGQAAVVGVLMIVQGVLDLLMGIFFGGYAFLAPEFMAAMQAQAAKQQPGNPTPIAPEALFFMTVYLGVAAGLLVLIGSLLIFSGISVMRYERRMLAVFSLALGMLSLLSCYCFPTSLMLGIYGLVFLMNPSVTLAFQLRQRGFSARRIQQAFLACRA